MKNISLLPPELKEEIRKKQNFRYYLYTAVAVLSLFMIFYISMLVMTTNYRSLYEFTRNQRLGIENQISGLEEYDLMRIQAEEAETKLKQALGNVPEWSLLLRNISNYIPGDVWIEEIRADFTEESGSITFRGWGASYQSVSKWLKNINEISGIREVRCNYSEETTTEGKDAISFEINAEIEPGEPFERMMEGKLFNESG